MYIMYMGEGQSGDIIIIQFNCHSYTCTREACLLALLKIRCYYYTLNLECYTLNHYEINNCTLLKVYRH